MPLPRNPELSKTLADGDLVAGALQPHQRNICTLWGFDEATLRKTERFVGDQSVWSVMGFLRGLYGHRAYHLGNIVSYLRQAGTAAPDF